jgi:hypothetical protein
MGLFHGDQSAGGRHGVLDQPHGINGSDLWLWSNTGCEAEKWKLWFWEKLMEEESEIAQRREWRVREEEDRR